MDINLLTPLANQYLSCFDTVDKQAAMEAAVIAMNETIVAINNLKDLLKDNSNKISVANTLSIALALSNVTNDIRTVNHHLETQKYI